MKHFVSAILFIIGLLIIGGAMESSLSLVGILFTALCGFVVIGIAYIIDKETIDEMNKEARK